MIKKILSKAVLILIYLLLLLYLTDFRISVIFDGKGILAVTGGMLLLTTPFWLTKKSGDEIMAAMAVNGLYAGYISTFMFLFSRLNSTVQFENLLADVALNCRPILYGFIFYLLLKPDKKETAPQQTVPQQPGVVSVDAEQLYFYFRSVGLTAREAEVARLLYNRLSNAEIAGQLFISETTVKKHVTHIFEKLDIERRDQIREVVSLSLSPALGNHQSN